MTHPTAADAGGESDQRQCPTCHDVRERATEVIPPKICRPDGRSPLAGIARRRDPAPQATRRIGAPARRERRGDRGGNGTDHAPHVVASRGFGLPWGPCLAPYSPAGSADARSQARRSGERVVSPLPAGAARRTRGCRMPQGPAPLATNERRATPNAGRSDRRRSDPRSTLAPARRVRQCEAARTPGTPRRGQSPPAFRRRLNFAGGSSKREAVPR